MCHFMPVLFAYQAYKPVRSAYLSPSMLRWLHALLIPSRFWDVLVPSPSPSYTQSRNKTPAAPTSKSAVSPSTQLLPSPSHQGRVHHIRISLQTRVADDSQNKPGGVVGHNQRLLSHRSQRTALPTHLAPSPPI